jgi:hypothetical protein
MTERETEREAQAVRITEISFPGGRIVDGRFRPEKGGTAIRDPKTGTVMMRPAGGGPGSTIEPCECALETGGSCSQAVVYGPDGDITEIWCVDDGCGFCVGGISPEGAGFTLRVTLAR